MAMRELKLLIVDDHAIFREGLRALLDMEEDFAVIGEASRGDEAVSMVADEPPDVILLDLHLPDGNGADFCRRLLQASPESKVLAPTVAAKVVRQLSRLREETGRQEEALEVLTPREREVFFLASRGLKNSEIAEELYLSEKTIKTHLRNIYNKLNLASKAELRLFAVKMGLTSETEA
jgi:RNA polymerase sigma factor (sigma-70 family)